MAFLHSQMRHHDKNIYYIHNKEIQEFLVKMKMLFLRSLEVFISSREINLCRMDTFPTMVANSQLCATGYRLLDYFELLCMQSLRKRICSVISINYDYITVLCPFNFLIRFKHYNTV